MELVHESFKSSVSVILFIDQGVFQVVKNDGASGKEITQFKKKVWHNLCII